MTHCIRTKIGFIFNSTVFYTQIEKQTYNTIYYYTVNPVGNIMTQFRNKSIENSIDEILEKYLR